MMDRKSSEKRGLGRGLSALMADVGVEQPSAEAPAPRRPDTSLPIEALAPNPDQPRREFVAEDLESLANSVREKGIIQPLIVRKNPDNTSGYQIIAGERRWRAAQIAQLHQVPVLIRDYDDAEVLEIAIIENIQRADLNPIEEAAGYRQLMERFGHTQEKLARALSKSRSHIANLMRLLQLPEDVQGFLKAGQLSTGHARALITSEDPSALARQVIAKGLSVRETERLSKSPVIKKGTNSAQKPEKDADTRALEADLSANIGMKVIVDHKPGQNAGQVVIKYKTLDDLDDLCRILTSMPLDETR